MSRLTDLSSPIGKRQPTTFTTRRRNPPSKEMNTPFLIGEQPTFIICPIVRLGGVSSGAPSSPLRPSRDSSSSSSFSASYFERPSNRSGSRSANRDSIRPLASSHVPPNTRA